MDAQSAFFNVVAADEAMHDPGPESNWNESAFFHVVEEDGSAGALFRIGRRVNEGFAEVTALQLRSTGDALVGFRKAKITDNLRWQAGDLDFASEGTGGGWSISFDGELSHLADGTEFADPGTAFRNSPKEKAAFDLSWADLAPPYRTSTDGTYHGGDSVAKDHYAGVGQVTGTVRIDGQEKRIRGFGFRDHSWGVRNWQSIDCWRWVYGQLDAGNLFSVVAMQVGTPEPAVAGIVLKDGTPHVVTEMSVKCRYDGAPDYWLAGADVTIPLPDGDVFEATYQPTCRLPLRHTKGDEVLRIVEHLANVQINGKSGAGWIEVTDRMEDGRPFGLVHGDA
ncbi:DUF7064 domain-containing protein [Rhodococcus opacus]|uniref:DUF7064 domain-containing protein n=1 Tax=Rhodococcus opacus TaxID=37919 RepID=UPI001C4538CE|nr:hypothetical protein [Rhodococcus opacus]MBV6762890.1 hypothetical protein [Rhodococcus opacus]